MNKRKFLNNIIFGLGGQLVILALGIFVPRLILRSYGDEANGFSNAITQVFTYLALIEAGIGQSALQALYRPLVTKDSCGVSSIYVATQNSFRKLTKIYILAVLVFALIYPLAISKDDISVLSVCGSDYLGAFLIIIITGITNAVGFYFVSTLKQVLIADGRNYIIVNITTSMRVVGSVVKILLINNGVNLVIVQFAALLVAIVEICVYKFFFKRKYSWIDNSVRPDYESQKEKKYFMIHELSNAIFCSTDMIILSVFCDLKTASVYGIYNMVFTAVNALVNSVHGGCYYVLGQAYNSPDKEYSRIHDCYDVYFISFVFFMMSVTYLLILPFVSLYTAGVTDQNYIDPRLPILFCLINLLSSCRITCSNLIKIAGHAKNTITRTVAEAAINLVVSLVAVQFFGIYGVLFGTIVALFYRSNDMIIYGNIKILHRSPLKSYKIVIINFIVFGIVVLFSKYNALEVRNYSMLFIYAVVYSVSLFVIFFVIGSLFNLDSLRTLKQLIVIKRKH